MTGQRKLIRPPQPFNDKDKGANLNSNEEKETELEAEAARRQKALERIEEQLEAVKKVEDEIQEEEETYEKPERLKKLPIVCGPSDKEREIHDRLCQT